MVVNNTIISQRLNDKLTSGTLASAGLGAVADFGVQNCQASTKVDAK
jgi:hypothetical protein